ncbi:MAG: mechanosensitive ion channel, partial [Deltaproteobacteria bacterium]|nr:mechanosensitive ion channel [Deltaproteobacteria bacterium]
TVGPFYQRGMTKAQNEKILITAQKNPGEVQKGSSEETVLKERAVDESAREEISDADRIISLQITIVAEEENLEKLKKELKERQAAFDNASNSLKDLTRKREKKQKKLHQVKEKDKSYNTEKLEGDISQLKEEQKLIKVSSALAFQALKTVQQQIETIGDKIWKDRDILDKLKGEKKSEESLPLVASPSTIPSTERVDPKITPVLPMLDTQPPDNKPSRKETPIEKPATAEQIAVRKEAEKKAKDAFEAEQSIFEYVERKEILEEQIALQEKQLQTARDTSDNLDKILSLRQQELEEKIIAKAPQEELLKIQKEIRSIYDETEKIEDDSREREDRLRDLHLQYEAILREELGVMGEAERKREEAETARKKRVWMESPFHPRNMLRWATTHAPQMLLTIFALIVLRFIAHLSAERLARLMVKRGRGSIGERESRAQTLSESFKYAASLVIVVGGTLLLLEAAGVDIKTLLGGAAVIGLAVAFGAQNLMRDYFSGFMILLEEQYKLNDVITIGDATGVVEHMTMRTTVLRDLEGRAHFIPNLYSILEFRIEKMLIELWIY